VTPGIGFGGSGRKGLTRAGGSTVAQSEQRGAVVGARRGSWGRRQGGRGGSRCWCGSWGGVDGVGEGLKKLFVVTLRQPQCFRRCRGDEVAEDEERGGGRSTMMHSSYRRERRWTVAAKAAGGSGGGGEAVGTTKPQRLRSKSRRRGWELLFGQGHRPVGPA
jgi:hypothetical protein